MLRLSVAELKQLVSRPDVVEMHDVTARDPRLLVHLKSTRQATPPLLTPLPLPLQWGRTRSIVGSEPEPLLRLSLRYTKTFILFNPYEIFVESCF